MKKPDSALEKQFNAGGIFFLPSTSIFNGGFEAGLYIGVGIEIAIPVESGELSVPEFSFSVVSKRGVALLFTDWNVLERNGIRHLAFSAWLRSPQDLNFGGPIIGMPFMDLCFYTGNEAIPEDFASDVSTVMREDAAKGDLGWAIPSRLTDHLVESLGKLNASVLSGLLQDAIVYGPFFTELK